MSAAEVVLGEKGLEEFTMAAVAAEAGVSVGGIYRRFENKRALLLGLHDWVISRLERSIDAAVNRDLPDLEAVIDALLSLLVDLYENNEKLYSGIFQGGNDPVQAARARLAVSHGYESFRTALLRHREHIRHSDLEAATGAAYHMVFSATMSRIGRVGATPYTFLTWSLVRSQVRAAVLAYLVSPPQSA